MATLAEVQHAQVADLDAADAAAVADVRRACWIVVAAGYPVYDYDYGEQREFCSRYAVG